MRPLTKKEQTLLSAGQAGMTDKEFMLLEQTQETNDLLSKLLKDESTPNSIDNTSVAQKISDLFGNLSSSNGKTDKEIETIKKLIKDKANISDIKPLINSLLKKNMSEIINMMKVNVSDMKEQMKQKADTKQLDTVNSIIDELSTELQILKEEEPKITIKIV